MADRKTAEFFRAPKMRCRAQPLLPWPADGLFAGEELGLLSRALLLQLVRPKSS